MSKIPISLDEEFEEKFQEFKRNHNYNYIKISGLQPKQLDFAGYIKDFCDSNILADASVDGTSNQSTKDVVSLENDISKPIMKMIAYNKIFVKLKEKYGIDVANDFLESELSGKSYLHDAYTSTLIPYCYAYDLSRLAREGLFFLNTGNIPYNNKPASHLDSFVNHIKEFVSFCCNRQAGAVGLPNLLPWMYYFWRKDIKEGYNGCKELTGGKTGAEDFTKINYNNQNIKYFSQCVQSLIYALNQPYLRNSIQTAFTNVSIFDHEYAHALFDGMVFPDESLAFDCIDDIVELQKLFLTVISDKIRPENMFTFPVLSISLLVKKDENGNKIFVDENFAHWASDHNTKWFDSNFYISESVDALSNCCRLSSSIKDMMNNQGYFNSVGGSGLSVGSIKVHTINLANVAYQSLTEATATSNSDIIKSYFTNAESLYMNKLKEQAYLNMKALDVIRDILMTNKNKRGLLPNIADGLIDMKHMYNTLGVVGVYETIKAYQNKLDSFKEQLNIKTESYDYIKYDAFGNTYYTNKAEQFVQKLFKTLHETIKKFIKEYKVDYSINCEQIPAETAAKKLMQKDELTYPDMAVIDLPLYGNQFIPLGIKTTLEERVRVAALFDSYLNGGSICHINYESTLDKEQAWNKLKWIAQQGLTYSAFTTKISACKHNHGFFGSICPVCGEKAVTTYARIVGFYTATGIDANGKDTGFGSWSTARKEEFKLREWEN